MESYETGEYHYDKQTLLSEHELLLTRTQTNTIDSSIQTIELQTSKLIELNNLRAIKISDLTPGHNNANKLIYSTQITPIAIAEVIYFIIEDEYSNVCRVSIPANVDTVHLVKGVRLAFSNPIYKMAFDGRYSLVVHNTSNISLLPFESFAQLKSEKPPTNSNYIQYQNKEILNTNADNTTSEQGDTKLEINNEIDLFSMQINPVESLLQQLDQEQQEETDITSTSIYLCQSSKIASEGDGFNFSQFGKRLFTEGRYLQAIVQYTCAIHADTNNAVFYSNRAQCYSKIGEFENALTDFKRATQLDPESFKYQYLVALTWSRIGNHNLSLDLLRKIKPKNSGDSQLVRKIIKEEENFTGNIKGKFDFIAMRRNETKQNKIGEFIGPIQILPSPKHGRGLFTTRRVKKGENLCVVKAIELLDTNLSNCGCDNCRKKTIKNAPLKESLFTKVVECARKSKLTTARLVSLCDTSIKKVNIGLYSSCGHEFAKNFDTSLYPVDKLQTLVEDSLYLELDHFDPGSYFLHFAKTFLPEVNFRMVNFLAGVWLLPSFINHSCIPNAYKIYIGDLCIVRAIADIPVGKEVFTSYCRLSLFPKVLGRHYFLGFHCTCRLCKFETKAEVIEVHSKILSLYDYLKTFDEAPVCTCILNLALQPKPKEPFTREIWLDIKRKIFIFADQLKLVQGEFMSEQFQASVICLLRLSICVDDAMELFLEAEHYFSHFEPESFVKFWILSMGFHMHSSTQYQLDPRFQHIEQDFPEVRELFT